MKIRSFLRERWDRWAGTVGPKQVPEGITPAVRFPLDFIYTQVGVFPRSKDIVDALSEK